MHHPRSQTLHWKNWFHSQPLCKALPKELWALGQFIQLDRLRFKTPGNGSYSGNNDLIAQGCGGQIIAANRQKNIAIAITSNPALPARSDGYFGDLMRLLEGPILDLA